MALVAEETKLVTIDGNERPVSALPAEAQQLIRFYDDWKQKEVEARSALLLAQTGMRSLANEIAAIVKKADEAAEEAAAEEATQNEDAAAGESDA